MSFNLTMIMGLVALGFAYKFTLFSDLVLSLTLYILRTVGYRGRIYGYKRGITRYIWGCISRERIWVDLVRFGLHSVGEWGSYLPLVCLRWLRSGCISATTNSINCIWFRKTWTRTPRAINVRMCDIVFKNLRNSSNVSILFKVSAAFLFTFFGWYGFLN